MLKYHEKVMLKVHEPYNLCFVYVLEIIRFISRAQLFVVAKACKLFLTTQKNLFMLKIVLTHLIVDHVKDTIRMEIY